LRSVQRADGEPPIRGILLRRPSNSTEGVVAQLAEELGVASKGNSLTGPTGRRVVFGASRALRHLITQDGETLTFGAPSELLRKWVVAIVLDLERDWTWDGLDAGQLTVLRAAPDEAEADGDVVGAVTVPRVLGTASTTKPTKAWRRRTRLVFFDAIDPHDAVAGGFPIALEHRWYVQPHLRPPGPDGPVTAPTGAVEQAHLPLDLRLPIAVAPAQVPDVASVGLAWSPYVTGPDYESTEQRRRALWIELTEPIENPDGDGLFARVLAHGSDPLLYDAPAEAVTDAIPPLPIDAELIRVVVPDDTDDRAGENAMTKLVPSSTSNLHYLLTLPPGIGPDDPELFGFWTYELRVGHSGAPGDLRWWSTANGRFGPARRVVGVQHPPPPLVCQAGRYRYEAPQTGVLITELQSAFTVAPMASISMGLHHSVADVQAGIGHIFDVSPVIEHKPRVDLILATAPFATPVLDGLPLAGPSTPPWTTLWFFVYAQAVQADGSSMRNILLASVRGEFIGRRSIAQFPTLRKILGPRITARHRDRTGFAVFTQSELEHQLADLHLPPSSPLSMLAVELLPSGTGSFFQTHAGVTRTPGASRDDFMSGRIMRTSPLVPIEALC